MKRGDVIVAVSPGDYGKPRPSIVIQSNRVRILGSMILCPLTSDLAAAAPLRVVIEPSSANGLRRRSHAMIDKLSAFSKERCREVIGALDSEVMAQIDQRLLLLLGLAD